MGATLQQLASMALSCLAVVFVVLLYIHLLVRSFHYFIPPLFFLVASSSALFVAAVASDNAVA